MKKSRYSEEQIVRILRETDKATVSEPSIYAWKKRFGDMDSADIKRLKALESENAHLKRVLAERVLEIEVMKLVNAKKW